MAKSLLRSTKYSVFSFFFKKKKLGWDKATKLYMGPKHPIKEQGLPIILIHCTCVPKHQLFILFYFLKKAIISLHNFFFIKNNYLTTIIICGYNNYFYVDRTKYLFITKIIKIRKDDLCAQRAHLYFPSIVNDINNYCWVD